MDKAKIRLSPKEAELVSNADWILTKNGILQKAKFLLEDLQSSQLDFLQSHIKKLPAEVTNIPPKISKGENYKGLPYLVLDHPRYFEGQNHLAIRSMFWWGNFFSITLQLSGMYKKIYESKIETAFPYLKKEKFSVCISTGQWEHHFETNNYLPLKDMNADTFKKHSDSKDFIKLAKMYPLQHWDDAGYLLMTSFSGVIKLLTS